MLHCIHNLGLISKNWKVLVEINIAWLSLQVSASDYMTNPHMQIKDWSHRLALTYDIFFKLIIALTIIANPWDRATTPLHELPLEWIKHVKIMRDNLLWGEKGVV